MIITRQKYTTVKNNGNWVSARINIDKETQKKLGTKPKEVLVIILDWNEEWTLTKAQTQKKIEEWKRITHMEEQIEQIKKRILI